MVMDEQKVGVGRKPERALSNVMAGGREACGVSSVQLDHNAPDSPVEQEATPHVQD